MRYKKFKCGTAQKMAMYAKRLVKRVTSLGFSIIIGSSGFAQDNIIVSMSVILVGIVTAMILKKYGLFH